MSSLSRKIKKLNLPSHVTRDTGLYLVGMGGIIYEIVIDHGDRSTLLVLLGAMVGLPSFLRADEKRAATKEEPDKPDKP